MYIQNLQIVHRIYFFRFQNFTCVEAEVVPSETDKSTSNGLAKLKLIEINCNNIINRVKRCIEIAV